MVRARQEEGSVVLVSSNDSLDSRFLRSYFRLDDDLEKIFSEIRKDEQISAAIQRFYGLRLMKQEIWECLISFVIATNANIPRIRGMISALCEKFGDPVTFEGLRYATFPSPEALAGARMNSLVECGLGYRARFVKAVAQKVRGRNVFLEELAFLDYERARDTLIEEVLGKKTLLGIGRKAADCILLFSCGKDSAFPIDVWMARVLAKYYPRLFDTETVSRLESHVSKKARLTGADYARISGTMRGYFGGYAGYAQQYLFHHARMEPD